MRGFYFAFDLRLWGFELSLTGLRLSQKRCSRMATRRESGKTTVLMCCCLFIMCSGYGPRNIKARAWWDA